MATFLKGVAKTEDKEPSYLDICLPVPMLEKNMILVDTPGIADKTQEDVAKLMMDYFPNALAVVFVVNVANAGGIQEDRLCRIIEHVKNSKKDMICYDPEDTLFLLNKWDAIPDEEQRQEHFEEAKHSIHKIWEEITDSHILRISAAKPFDPEFKGLFNDFERILEEIIAKNENKRLMKHQKYLKNFLEECIQNAEKKLDIANNERYQCEQKVKSLENQVSEMEEIDKKMETFVSESFNMFVEEASDGCYKYLKTSLLKEKVTKDTDKFTRFQVGKDMLTKICKETLNWQKQNLKPTMQEVLMNNLKQEFKLSKMSLDSMEKQMQEMDVNFDPKGVFLDALATFVKFTTAGVASGALLAAFAFNPVITLSIMAVGTVGGFGYAFLWEDFKKLRDNEYDKIVEKIGKCEIAVHFEEWYEKPFCSIVIDFLKKESKDLQRKLKEIKQTHVKLAEKVNVLEKVKIQIGKCREDLYD